MPSDTARALLSSLLAIAACTDTEAGSRTGASHAGAAAGAGQVVAGASGAAANGGEGASSGGSSHVGGAGAGGQRAGSAGAPDWGGSSSGGDGGDGQAGGGEGGAGTGGAGTGGAGTGGAGTGGAGLGGASGGAGGFTCPPGSSYSTLTLCVDPTGKSTEPIQSAFKIHYQCAALARDAAEDCKSPEVACSAAICEVHALKPTGAPVKTGDDCCYPTAVCYGGAGGCGRPLLADGRARVAAAVARADWT